MRQQESETRAGQGSEGRYHVAYVLQSVGIDPMTGSGPSILIRQTLRQIRRANHDVDLISLRARDVVRLRDANENSPAEHLPLGIAGRPLFLALESVIRRVQSELGLPYFGLFESLRIYQACRRILDDYDLCHEYHRLFSLGATLACQRAGKPFVLTMDADELMESKLSDRPVKGLQALVAGWSTRRSLRTAARIICVSESTKRRLIEYWGVPEAKIRVLANGVDPDTFNPKIDVCGKKQELGLPDGSTVAFIGGFQPWHGLVNLVESFSQVVRERPWAKLVLVGDGPTRPAVEQSIRKHSLEEQTLLTGEVAYSEIPTWLAMADVAVAPYSPLPYEMWFSPLKLFEYMAAGKAIVASDAGQISQIIRHGESGLLVRPGDSAELSQAVIRLLDDPSLAQRLGRKAREQAVKEHSWAMNDLKLHKIYQEALAEQ